MYNCKSHNCSTSVCLINVDGLELHTRSFWLSYQSSLRTHTVRRWFHRCGLAMGDISAVQWCSLGLICHRLAAVTVSEKSWWAGASERGHSRHKITRCLSSWWSSHSTLQRRLLHFTPVPHNHTYTQSHIDYLTLEYD